MARTSVVVPCYNAAGTLPRCLKALLEQTSRPREVIVVDDCSTDESRRVAAQFAVAVVAAPRKLHAGGARAAGFLASSGDFVAFVDSDVVLHPTWMERALRHLEEDLSLGAVGGAVEPPASQNVSAWADYFMSFSAYFSGLQRSRRAFLPTGNMLVRRRPLEAVRFRESHGDEDVDLSHQLVDQGYGLLFSPELRAFHLGWRTSLRELARVQRRYAVGFLSGRSRVPRTRRLLALPLPLFVPAFTLLKLGQILGRTWGDGGRLAMFVVASPLIAAMLTLRASLVHSLRASVGDAASALRPGVGM